MDRQEAIKFQSELESYTNAHRCSWPEAMKKLGINEDPDDFLDRDANERQLENNNAINCDSTRLAINGIKIIKRQ